MVLAVVVGCQTLPKEATVAGASGSAEGQWRAKALVRNLRTGDESVLDLDVIAKEPSWLRMEITGPFGVHLASIALTSGEVRYVLSQEKRFVVTPAGSDAFARLVPVRISPTALLALLFDRGLPGVEWRCDSGPKNQLATQCRHLRENVMVQWMERSELSRRIKIFAREAEIEMVINQAKSKVDMKPESFKLQAPNGFKVERLTSS